METSITDGFRDIFLAGVGALSITGEKAKEVIDELVARGQVSVDQGRKINEELRHRGAVTAEEVREKSARAILKTLSPDERARFIERMSAISEEMAAAEDGAAHDAQPADEADGAPA